jgi:anti-sigma B factor antagonist
MSDKHGSHWLEREDFGEVTVARLKTPKRLDDDIAHGVFDPIYALVDSVGRRKVVLNLAPVEYLPSLAVGKLVMLNRKVQAAGGRLALCQLTPTVREVLDTTHLTPLFHVFPTEPEAVESFGW